MLIVVAFYAESIIADDLCQITTETTGQKLPILPDQFQAHIETNIQSDILSYSKETDEFYDFTNGKGTVVEYQQSEYPLLVARKTHYFLYNTDELITVEGLKEKNCLVFPLNKSVGENPFGILSNGSSFSINSPSYVTKFGFNFNYTTYEGKDEARGIKVDKWSSCFKIKEAELFGVNATVKITWLWSDKTWSTISKDTSFPVEMTVEYKFDSGVYQIEKYQYTAYVPYLMADPSIFETPRGVYCEGRKATKPLPNVPNAFSYKMEINLIENKDTTAQMEWYDFNSNLARYDHQPLTIKDKDIKYSDSISEIHDFNGGVRYIIDKKTENCLNITELDPYSEDSEINENKTVRFRTAFELFHFDKVNYTYHGTRKIRDIDCDVWIAKRNDWPSAPGKATESIWEWAFMSSEWSAINSGPPQYNIPIELTIRETFISHSRLIVTTVYNYFDFKTEKPDIFDFGLEACFNDIKSRHLEVTFENIDGNSISNKHEFRYQILNTIASLTYILPTRIDQVDLDFKDGDTIASFKILDKASIHGNVENPIAQLSLDDAYSMLKRKINDGDFFFIMDNTLYKAKSGSLMDVNAKSSGYSGFLMFLAIVISAIAGIVLGSVGFFTYKKIKDKMSSQPPLSMSGLMNK